ncbi:unnamed protein product, partial [Sphacelaria rigidula]
EQQPTSPRDVALPLVGRARQPDSQPRQPRPGGVLRGRLEAAYSAFGPRPVPYGGGSAGASVSVTAPSASPTGSTSPRLSASSSLLGESQKTANSSLDFGHNRDLSPASGATITPAIPT